MYGLTWSCSLSQISCGCPKPSTLTCFTTVISSTAAPLRSGFTALAPNISHSLGNSPADALVTLLKILALPSVDQIVRHR